jgi:hypothetical protein
VVTIRVGDRVRAIAALREPRTGIVRGIEKAGSVVGARIEWDDFDQVLKKTRVTQWVALWKLEVVSVIDTLGRLGRLDDSHPQ